MVLAEAALPMLHKEMFEVYMEIYKGMKGFARFGVEADPSRAMKNPVEKNIEDFMELGYKLWVGAVDVKDPA